jgi:hypothetical protein
MNSPFSTTPSATPAIGSSATDFAANVRLLYGQIAEDPTQHFVVDGDSLLFDKFADSSLDWRNGGQFLTMIYLLESLLEKLMQSSRRFDLVFFDEMKHSPWYQAGTTSAASRALMRAIAIQHLSTHCAVADPAGTGSSTPSTAPTAASIPGTLDLSINSSTLRFQVKLFNSWHCQEWAEYVSECNPSFVMVSGAHARLEVDRGADAPASYDQSDSEAVQQSSVFQRMILQLLDQGLSCVSSRHLIFRDDQASSFFLLLRPKKKNDIKRAGNCDATLAPKKKNNNRKQNSSTAHAVPPPSHSSATTTALPGSSCSFDTALFARIGAQLQKLQCPAGSNMSRLLLSLYACTTTLRSYSGSSSPALSSSVDRNGVATEAPRIAPAEVAKVLLMQTLLLDVLPLQHRAQPLSEDETHFLHCPAMLSVWSFLGQFFSYAASVTDHAPQLATESNFFGAYPVLCDFFDGRLMCKLLLCALSNSTSLTLVHTEYDDYLTRLWNMVVNECKISSSTTYLPLVQTRLGTSATTSFSAAYRESYQPLLLTRIHSALNKVRYTPQALIVFTRGMISYRVWVISQALIGDVEDALESKGLLTTQSPLSEEKSWDDEDAYNENYHWHSGSSFATRSSSFTV